MTFNYISKYDSTQLRGMDDTLTPRPWDLFNEIKKHANTTKTFLHPV